MIKNIFIKKNVIDYEHINDRIARIPRQLDEKTKEKIRIIIAGTAIKFKASTEKIFCTQPGTVKRNDARNVAIMLCNEITDLSLDDFKKKIDSLREEILFLSKM